MWAPFGKLGGGKELVAAETVKGMTIQEVVIRISASLMLTANN